MSERRSLLPLACLGLFHLACETLPPPYHISAPEGPPDGVMGRVEDSGRAILHLDHLDLAVLAIDATATRPAAAMPSFGIPAGIPSLMIRFEFAPKVLGYSFNPMRIGLRTQQGVLNPTAYVGPGEIVSVTSGRSHAKSRHCRKRPPGFWRWLAEGEELPARTESQLHSLGPNASCFVVSFDTAVARGS